MIDVFLSHVERAPSPAALDSYERSKPAPPATLSERWPGFVRLFVTFRAWSSQPMSEDIRDIVMQHCLHDQERKYHLHAAVVMPEHVHLLLTALRDQDGYLCSLVEILQSLKSASAHRINRSLGRLVRSGVAG